MNQFGVYLELKENVFAAPLSSHNFGTLCARVNYQHHAMNACSKREQSTEKPDGTD